MRYIKKYNESENVSIFSQESKNFFPDKIYLATTHGDWELDKKDLMLNGDLIQIAYYHNPVEESGDVLSDGEPDFLEFDIHTDKNERGIKLLVDITYGDSMVSEFSIEAPNKINVIHYTGINSKYEPETYFGFTDETINDLVKLFNSFNHGLKLTADDFKFIDKDPDSYKHDIHNSDHLYNDDSDLISFGNSMKESMSNDIILVINNSKPPENKYLPKVLKYLDSRNIEYKVASSPEDIIKYNKDYNIIGALSTGSDYRVKDGDEVNSMALSELKCPILAMCFGYQSMAKSYGSNIDSDEENCGLFNLSDYDESHFLFNGIDLSQQKVSFCFHDYPSDVPSGFEVIAMLGDVIAGISSKNRYGLLFHPEELESTYIILDNFVNSCKVNKGSEMKYLQTFENFNENKKLIDDILDDIIKYLSDISLEAEDIGYTFNYEIIEPTFNRVYHGEDKYKLKISLEKKGNKEKSMWSILSELDDIIEHMDSYLKSNSIIKTDTSSNSKGISFKDDCINFNFFIEV